MREIKFRAWDKEGKVMMPVDMVYFRDRADQRSKRGDIHRVGAIHGFGYKVANKFELMQYTGLKDKNGREVYEGDIINCSSGCLHEVVWMQEVPTTAIMGGMPGFYLSGLKEGYSWFGNKEEVIGNIYESGDLLK